MLAALEHPIAAPRLVILACAVVAALAVYCLAYNALQGQPVTMGDALAWPVANVVPILIGFELAKRQHGWSGRLLILAASLALALGIGAALTAHQYFIGFEAIRRLPVLFGSIAILAVLDIHSRRNSTVRRPADLPIPPDAIDWVEAAANYVVLHGKGLKVVHRATLSQVEAVLGHRDFLRIHRSRLVARRAVARVRPQDVILRDGRSLATGARFRPGLERLTQPD